MFQFTRTVEAKHGAYLPSALKFAGEVTTYLNKTYGLKLHFGAEVFSGATIHWYFDVNSLDELSALNAKLMQDREYAAILDRAKDIWLEGSFRDRVVNVIA